MLTTRNIKFLDTKWAMIVFFIEFLLKMVNWDLNVCINNLA